MINGVSKTLSAIVYENPNYLADAQEVEARKAVEEAEWAEARRLVAEQAELRPQNYEELFWEAVAEDLFEVTKEKAAIAKAVAFSQEEVEKAIRAYPGLTADQAKIVVFEERYNDAMAGIL